MIKKFDTIFFDRPESFLMQVQWGNFIVPRSVERDIALTNSFQTYNFQKNHNEYNITLDGLLMQDGEIISGCDGSFDIYSIVQSIDNNYVVEFKLTFDCDRLRKAICNDIKAISINSDKIRHDYENHIKKLKKQHKKDLTKAKDLEKQHMQALHELDMEKFKAEQLIIRNQKVAEEIKNISIIVNA